MVAGFRSNRNMTVLVGKCNCRTIDPTYILGYITDQDRNGGASGYKEEETNESEKRYSQSTNACLSSEEIIKTME